MLQLIYKGIQIGYQIIFETDIIYLLGIGIFALISTLIYTIFFPSEE